MKILLPLLLTFLVSCMDENLTPESALKNFIEARIGNVVTRQFVLERITGKMRQNFEVMSDDDFAKFADLRNVERDSFKVLSKSCQEKRCFVTYAIAYKTKKDEANYASEIKKIAELQLVEGKWLIADVSNVKTYHESLEAINPLE